MFSTIYSKVTSTSRFKQNIIEAKASAKYISDLRCLQICVHLCYTFRNIASQSTKSQNIFLSSAPLSRDILLKSCIIWVIWYIFTSFFLIMLDNSVKSPTLYITFYFKYILIIFQISASSVSNRQVTIDLPLTMPSNLFNLKVIVISSFNSMMVLFVSSDIFKPRMSFYPYCPIILPAFPCNTPSPTQKHSILCLQRLLI